MNPRDHQAILRTAAIEFLRFLAADASSQISRLAGAAEGSTFVALLGGGEPILRANLRLVLVVGADALGQVQAELPAERLEDLVRLYAVLFLINEFGGEACVEQIRTELESDINDERLNMTWPAGIWRLVQTLARSIVACLADSSSPSAGLRNMFEVFLDATLIARYCPPATR